MNIFTLYLKRLTVQLLTRGLPIMSSLLISAATAQEPTREPTKAPSKEPPQIVPQRAEVPTFDEAQAAAALIKNGISAQETAENMTIANSWRQQKTVNNINRLKLQETKQNLEYAKMQNELVKLQLENEALQRRSVSGTAPKNPVQDIKLTSIYADREGILKATLITKQGKLTVRRGYKVGNLIVGEIGTQHILLQHNENEYPLYVN